MASAFLGQEPVKRLKIRGCLVVAAVGQFVLMAAVLKIHAGVPAEKGQEKAQVVVKEIVLPFVCIRHWLQDCAYGHFAVHEQKVSG